MHTKFRSFNLSSNMFYRLDQALRRIFGVVSERMTVLEPDRGYTSIAPGKPIKGEVNFTHYVMNGVSPRFYWADELLTIAITDAISFGPGRGGYAQESSFWGNIEDAVVKLGGRSAGAGTGEPPNLPRNAMYDKP